MNMWKSNSTLERQLEESRRECEKLKEQLETTKKMLEHQVKENSEQEWLLRTYHKCTEAMITRKAEGFCKVLEALSDEFNSIGHYNNYMKDDHKGHYSTEGVQYILKCVYKDTRSASETRQFSKELLSLLTKTERM